MHDFFPQDLNQTTLDLLSYGLIYHDSPYVQTVPEIQ